MTASNPQRLEITSKALQRKGLDALLCSLPVNVLMLSGYWPVVGRSFAVATYDGRVGLLVPEDELEFIATGWAHHVASYQPGSLSELRNPIEVAAEALGPLLAQMGVKQGRLGCELGPASVPASYAAMNVLGGSIVNVLRCAAPASQLVPADEMLSQLASIKTPEEVERIRGSCSIASIAFEHAARQLWVGMREGEAVSIFYAAYRAAAAHFPRVLRPGAHFYCMSGPNAARAWAAFAHTRNDRILRGETVMIHCNSYADGYWTDITRTYVIGQPRSEMCDWYSAVFDARSAALSAIRPGASCSEVDRAARSVLEARGFGSAFRHTTGHGVGFAAISANAAPRLHPKSPDLLHAGMTFNVEPAVYFEGSGGVRQCDVVVVTERGAEVLTAFHEQPKQLWLPDDEMLMTG